MREEELPLGEKTQKMGEETPSPKFKPFSNAPRGHRRCGMAPPCGPCYRPNTHLQTWKSLNPLSVSLEAQCLNPNPLSPRFGFLPSRLTPREAKGGKP
jgi:hypothetical protein